MVRNIARRSAARGASLALGLVTAAALIAAPFLVVRQMTATTHAVLALLLAGMSAAFVHGVGFEPRSALWKRLVSPWITWPAMAVGWALLVRFGGR